MTPEQWLEKHYPVPAKKLAEATDEECLLHCENKWEGAKEENLPDNAQYIDHGIDDENDKEIITFDYRTCALCEKYPLECEGIQGRRCPIVRMQSKSCCDSFTYDRSENDPGPMIDLLKRTLEFVRNGG